MFRCAHVTKTTKKEEEEQDVGVVDRCHSRPIQKLRSTQQVLSSARDKPEKHAAGCHSGSARESDLTGASTSRRGFGIATRQSAKSFSDRVLLSCLQTHTIRGSSFFILFPSSLFLVFLFFFVASWGDEAEEQTLDVSS